ncbi:hypothetical protein O181_011351 [Austropuccinia psidii MF-1]|uniref:Uncharacterized protein n=1 Tax=Austropuccinia psidii MF-1 TaxID=1389203 RepID=A0A9Q3BVL4_9BASI|nr:hypothetical protein [Austropuccinia psidii MF-1]
MLVHCPTLPTTPPEEFPTKTPLLPREETPWQLTPGPSGTQWLEDLFHSKQQKFPLISTFDSSELTLYSFVETSQPNEPPFFGLSPSSEPHEDVPTHEPEPEVTLMQSIEEPFAKSPLNLFYSSKIFLTLLQPSSACPPPPPP